MDCGVNEQFKSLMQQEFTRNEVQEAMTQGVSDIKIGLRASLMKPLHANWLISTLSTLSDKPDSIV